MTTPLTSEPMPGDGQVPFMHTFTDRLYRRLPEVYATLDAQDSTWTLKRFLAAILTQGGAGDDLYTAILGERPVGPATPVPWALAGQDLTNWLNDRHSRLSSLGDPFQADPNWLPWLAQMVGVRLNPAASLIEQRDTIAYATSGWRGGTVSAIEDAARSALTGSQYATVQQATAGNVAGTPWDLTIVTRASETPDPSAVIGAVLRKEVKPAGVILHTRTYESSWDTLEAARPTWDDWEAAGSWTALEETGLSYADVLDNLMANPSFESGTTGWTPLHGAGLTAVTGGIDSVHMGQLVASATGSGFQATAPISGILAGRDYSFSFSINPDVDRPAVTLNVAWTDSGGGALATTSQTVPATGGIWQRIATRHTAPAGAAHATLSVDEETVTTGAISNYDAGLFRLISTGE